MNDTLIRIVPFLAVLGIMAGWEFLSPRRERPVPRKRRWPVNLGITLLNTLVLRLLFPTAAVGAALLAETHHWGLFNVFNPPESMVIAGCVILLDLAIYLQHVLVHKIPLFWRFHRMHHSDIDLDVTSGLRFHPVEIIFSMLIKYAIICLLGAPVLAVLIFETVLNCSAMFNHSNVYIPPALDRMLRWIIVTPDMHRVHHSILREETDSNYGFNLPWWDRLFRTYRPAPTPDQLRMTIGLPIFRDPADQTLKGLLKQPFAPLT